MLSPSAGEKVESEVPFYIINEFFLLALNKIIQKVHASERHNAEVVNGRRLRVCETADLKAQLKGKEDYIVRIENDLQKLKEVNTNSIYQQYVLLTEQVVSGARATCRRR